MRHALGRIPRAASCPRQPLPVLPMLAKRVGALPEGADWIYEPKWDGFRVLVFRDGDELLLQSREAKPLDRYFPELRAPLLAQLPERCALDGELVIALDDGLDFEALQQRIHPAVSRIKLLAEEIPASIVFWDLLCQGERDLRGEPFRIGAPRSRRCSRARSRRCTSRRSPRTGASRQTGSAASRAPGSTA